MAQQKKKVNIKTTELKKESLLGSIKGKVLFMGILSILASVMLGVVGVSSLSKNSVNNEVLAKINNINLKQYENQSLETSYLYFLEDSYLEQIISNLQTMEANATEAVKLTSGKQKTEMENALANITACKENYEQIRALCQERGFTSEVGSYAQFVANDATLEQDFSTVANDKSWVDGKWMDAYVGESIEADGTVYSKMTYDNELPQAGKRDYFLPRIGGNGMIFDGTIYLTNLVFSGSSDSYEVDFSTVDVATLNGSYGEGLDSMEIGEIEGKPALKIQSSYTGADGGWEEISIKLPASDINVHNYTNVSFDLYFENVHPDGMAIACAISDKYAFADKLNSVNSSFITYSKHVVEGKDVTEEAAAITAMLNDIITNVPEYVIDESLKSSIMTNMEAKKSLFEQMNASDSTILELKKENIAISSALSEEADIIREAVEADTNATKTSLTLAIAAILVVSAAILIVITVAVSRSMNRSIRKFKETLRQVTEGNLSVRADEKGKDEFAVFGNSLNAFLAKLAEIINSAQHISEDVSASGDELRGMSESTSETADEIERAVEDISRGASSQAEDIEQASESIAVMGETFGKIVTNVENLNNITDDMSKMAQESTMFMKELAASNEKTARAFEQVAQQIHITNESVKKIHEAADFITSIASQTNLLSLNASIEAARAGEAGKGFAVVATEIQQLSIQSNTSAANIESIIKELSMEASKTVDIIDEVSSVVNDQQNKLISTQEKFVTLEASVQTAGKETNEIMRFTGDCDKARKKVEDVMENLSAISEENAASSEETTASMAQLNATIMKLAEEARDLNKMAEQLEGDLKFFHL